MKTIFNNKRGNIALLFGLLAAPLMGVIGLGIEVANVNSLKTEAQGAVDAAVLKAAQSSIEADTFTKEEADKVLNAQMANSRLKNIRTEVTNTVLNGKTQLNYVAKGDYETVLGLINGKDHLEISVTASSLSGAGLGSEIIFVLDTTASMAQNNRITNLKSAVNGVLDKMVDSEGTNLNGTKVGIVPFNTQVKIAPSTSYDYMNYGYSYYGYGCDETLTTGGYWPSCWMGWTNIDALCATAVSRQVCFDNLKLWDKPASYSGANMTYEQVVKSYEVISGKYRVYEHRIVFYQNASSCGNWVTDETGTYCANWVNSGEGLSTDTQNVYNNQTNLSKYTSSPGGGLTERDSPMYFKPWLGDGYGGPTGEYAWDYTSFSSTYPRKGWHPATPDQKSTWLGCISDRNQNYDVNAEAAVSNIAASLYLPRECQNQPLETMLDMTVNIADAKTKVNALQPAGYTNITIGLQWAMEMLSPNLPFNSGAAFSNKEIKKFIVLITDGENTSNRFSSVQSEVDARTSLACTNAKNLGITIYVVRLEEGDSTLLSQCASKPPYYFDLNSAANLGTALQSIFTSINSLRISE